MNAPRFKRTVQFTLIAVLAMAGLAIWKMHHEVKLASKLSAQNATLSQMIYLLTNWPAGKPYPSTLAKLHLTYPDGGDATILRRFEYRSWGTNCTLRARFGEKETVWSFP